MLAIGNERFLTINLELITVASSMRFDPLQITACARLGHADRTNNFARDHARQIFFFLSLATKVQNIRGNNI